ncbi:MAG: hypothetical protein HF978_14415 [Desulfobacteraceae bacterium]|nr:hypothetical protein [Desulfobacteraceae bacterium]MBC2756733.1 hypothetical protein [Desulfobacteraceae bacterium]
MMNKIKNFDNQKIIFSLGIICFVIIAVGGWVKLQYGFNFIDEGYHMTKSWRLTVGDHLLDDQYTSILRSYTIFNSLIFRINPDITLLGFRQIQFILALIALCFFSTALYLVTKDYWYYPFIFSIFAFTGLDPVGMIPNLNYYTYPHLFIALSVSCFIIGLQLKNEFYRKLFFIITGFFLWGISISLLHLSVIIIFPPIFLLIKQKLNFTSIAFNFKDLLYILLPFMFCWIGFIFIYQNTFWDAVFNSINYFLSSENYSATSLVKFNWVPLAYTIIAAVILSCYFFAIKKLAFRILIALLSSLSFLVYIIIETSFLGLIEPYYRGWFDRPMWLSACLIAFSIIFGLDIIKKIQFKQNLTKIDELIIIILIPATILSIASTIFSGLGPLTVLHSSIPLVAAFSLYIIYNKKLVEKIYFSKLIILMFILIPFYYTTAWADWRYTYFDVIPEQMDQTITSGFGKGIKTNKFYARLYEWIESTSKKFSSSEDFMISYIVSPMTHMIAKRRPSVDDTYLDITISPEKIERYLNSMKSKERYPTIAYVFERMPIMFPGSLKSGKYGLPSKQIIYSRPSDNALLNYIKQNMVLTAEFRISDDHKIRFFVDKKKMHLLSKNIPKGSQILNQN